MIVIPVNPYTVKSLKPLKETLDDLHYHQITRKTAKWQDSLDTPHRNLDH